MIFLLAIPALVFLVGFFLIPLGTLFFISLRDSYSAGFFDSFGFYVIQFTYFQAAISAFLSVIFGFVAAFLIVEWKIWGGKWIWRLGLLCSSLPSILVALGILGVWGPGTTLGSVAFEEKTLFGWAGILLGHVFLNFGIPMRLMGLALRQRNHSSELIALSLGMNRWRVFCQLTIPHIRTSILGAFLLAFIYSSTSLFILMFLGGGPRFTTLEVALYEAIKLNLDTFKAVQIAALQAVVGAGLFFLYYRSQRLSFLQEDVEDVGVFLPRHFFSRWLATGLLWGCVVLFLGMPLGSVLKEGIRDWGLGFNSSLFQATGSSLAIALGVVILSLVLLYPFLHFIYQFRKAEKREKRVWLVVFPQFFSSTVVAFALSVCYPSLRGQEGWGTLGVILTQTLFVIPLIYFPLSEGFQRLSQERLWIAQSLGASRWQRFLQVELPFMRRPLFLAGLIGFGFSMGEVVSVLLFAPPQLQTLSLAVFQAMSRYRFQEAHAATAILLLVIVLLFFCAGSLEEPDESFSH